MCLNVHIGVVRLDDNYLYKIMHYSWIPIMQPQAYSETCHNTVTHM